MSIMRSLMWLVDHNQWREEQAKHKRWMQQLQTPDPDDGDPPPSLDRKEEVCLRRCRVCGFESETEHFCPTCLADTLRKVEQ